MLPRHLILLGTAGAGKSTLSAMFARYAKCKLIKLDDEIEKLANKKVTDIFCEDGEAVFRALEEQALRVALSKPAAVIDPGGGIVERHANRQLLAESDSDRCYLNVVFDELLARIGDDDSRPMHRGGDLAQRLRELLQRRSGYFHELATCVVKVDRQQTADTTFARISSQLDWCKQLV